MMKIEKPYSDININIPQKKYNCKKHGDLETLDTISIVLNNSKSTYCLYCLKETLDKELGQVTNL